MNEQASPRQFLRDYLEFKFYVRLVISSILFLILLVLSVFNFISGKRDIVTLINVGLLCLTAVIVVISFVVIRMKHVHDRKKYLESTCYEVYQKPYKNDYHLPYYLDQIDAFEKIYRALSSPLYFDVVLENQVFDRGDISIDLILFHSSGIYAIQVLSYDGPLKGSIQERVWKPHFYLGLKKALTVDQSLYKNWLRHRLLTNPIMQTDLHVQNIQKYLPNYVIKGVSIFKETMIHGSFDSMNQKLFSLNDFLKYVQEQPSIYSPQDLKNAQSKLNKGIIIEQRGDKSPFTE